MSSAEETAKDVYRMLVAHGLERDPPRGEPAHRFLTTGDPEEFADASAAASSAPSSSPSTSSPVAAGP